MTQSYKQILHKIKYKGGHIDKNKYATLLVELDANSYCREVPILRLNRLQLK